MILFKIVNLIVLYSGSISYNMFLCLLDKNIESKTMIPIQNKILYKINS